MYITFKNTSQKDAYKIYKIFDFITKLRTKKHTTKYMG